MTRIDPSRFAEFYRAIHGREPFPWQVRLAGRVAADGTWPSTVDMPTSSGKTVLIDIAVFLLACGVATGRRIFYVVDRRTLDDAAHRYAGAIATAIAAAGTPILGEVKAALIAIGGDRDGPLQASILRGGMTCDRRWASSAVQPVVVCCTVDQYGSRLLFRGYGVSRRMRPIHAGLTGTDALVVIDEAHISGPFTETMARVAKLRVATTGPATLPFHVVRMSATVVDDPNAFRFDQVLDLPTAGDPTIVASAAHHRRRLWTPKPTLLVDAPEATGPANAAEPRAARDGRIAGACVDACMRLLGAIPTATVALIVVNRVSTAIAARDLVARLGKQSDGIRPRVIILTGRMRQVDRDRILRSCWRDISADGRRDRKPGVRPLVVIATQCIEVGVDLDSDILVTEMCPWSALRQRFGRLDRIGAAYGGHPPDTIAAIVRDSSIPVTDPIYGPCLEPTAAYIAARADSTGRVDMSFGSISAWPAPPTTVEPPTAHAVVLNRSMLDLLCQTMPEPSRSPAPGPFLRGPDRASPDVTVVWRADLDPESAGAWPTIIEDLPPVSGEGAPVRIDDVRRRFSDGRGRSDDQDDLEGGPPMSSSIGSVDRPVILRRDDTWAVETVSSIRPGDTVIVPSSYGGYDADIGWTGGDDHVVDVAHEAMSAAKRRVLFRFTPGVADVDAGMLPSSKDDPSSVKASITAACAVWMRRPSAIASGIAEALGFLHDDLVSGTNGILLEPYPAGGWLVAPRASHWPDNAPWSVDEDDDGSSFATERRVGLAEHGADVGRWSRHAAAGSGLAPALVDACLVSGHAHDLGKIDERMQVMLWYAGDGAVPAKDQRHPIAKSGHADRRIMRKAAEHVRGCGHPRGFRHELLSVALLGSDLSWCGDEHLRDLILHLVATHHGYCRPRAPIVDESDPLPSAIDFVLPDGRTISLHATGCGRPETFDSGIERRFWSMQRAYGAWGSAHLEACLRLGDHIATERPGSMP